MKRAISLILLAALTITPAVALDLGFLEKALDTADKVLDTKEKHDQRIEQAQKVEQEKDNKHEEEATEESKYIPEGYNPQGPLKKFFVSKAWLQGGTRKDLNTIEGQRNYLKSMCYGRSNPIFLNSIEATKSVVDEVNTYWIDANKSFAFRRIKTLDDLPLLQKAYVETCNSVGYNYYLKDGDVYNKDHEKLHKEDKRPWNYSWGRLDVKDSQ